MTGESDAPGSPQLRKRKSEGSADASNDSGSEEAAGYSQDQLEAVARINQCRDYYEILGVNKDAGESDLRRQYKRLALQFHPDKNKAPGSVEAFKSIGNAFAVLSDPAKRKRYDTYGLDAMQTTESNPQQGYYHTFEGDISAEELFNMFFNGSTYVRRGNQWHRYQSGQANTHTYQEQDTRGTLMQILPLVFIISVSLLSSFFINEPPYSLHRTTKYLYERRTHSLDVPYYVRDTFDEHYKEDLHRLERQIEDEHILNVRSACFRERNYKENMIWRAKHFRDASLENNAKKLSTPSCDILTELYRGYSKIRGF